MTKPQGAVKFDPIGRLRLPANYSRYLSAPAQPQSTEPQGSAEEQLRDFLKGHEYREVTLRQLMREWKRQ
jgi:hypothetical protein